MDKVLVEIYVPGIEQKFDMWLPIHKKIGKGKRKNITV